MRRSRCSASPRSPRSSSGSHRPRGSHRPCAQRHPRDRAARNSPADARLAGPLRGRSPSTGRAGPHGGGPRWHDLARTGSRAPHPREAAGDVPVRSARPIAGSMTRRRRVLGTVAVWLLGFGVLRSACSRRRRVRPCRMPTSWPRQPPPLTGWRPGSSPTVATSTSTTAPPIAPAPATTSCVTPGSRCPYDGRDVAASLRPRRAHVTEPAGHVDGGSTPSVLVTGDLARPTWRRRRLDAVAASDRSSPTALGLGLDDVRLRRPSDPGTRTSAPSTLPALVRYLRWTWRRPGCRPSRRRTRGAGRALRHPPARRIAEGRLAAHPVRRRPRPGAGLGVWVEGLGSLPGSPRSTPGSRTSTLRIDERVACGAGLLVAVRSSKVGPRRWAPGSARI